MDHPGTILLSSETAYAKINLCLDIIGRRQDGYHLISTLMQRISLSDAVAVGLYAHSDLGLPGNLPHMPGWMAHSAVAAQVPVGTAAVRIAISKRMLAAGRRMALQPSDNLMVRAALGYLRILAGTGWADRICGGEWTVCLDLDKQLPHGAGIGGGSADAAAVFRGLDRWFGLTRMPAVYDRLFRAAAELGGDIPFSLVGGLAHCTGIGERIRPLKEMPVRPMLLIQPRVRISTPAAFRCWDRAHPAAGESEATRQDPGEDRTAAALDAVGRGDWAALSRSVGNAFETVVRPDYPQLSLLLAAAAQTGAVMCRMTGSGSAVFAVYADADARARAMANRSLWTSAGGADCQLWPVEPVNRTDWPVPPGFAG